MDSLDELLADLHSATNYIKNEQQSFAPTPGSNLSSLSTSALDGHNPKHYVGDTPHHQFYSNDQQLSSQRFSPKGKVNTASVSNRNSDRYSASSNGSGDMPAPPLPPPPSRDVIEEANMGYSSEPLYEMQNLSSRVQDTCPSNPCQDNAGGYSYQTNNHHNHSTLGANLSELDYLLQDLNSVQFLEEINQPATSGVEDGSVLSDTTVSSTKVPPPTLPKPTQKSLPSSSNVHFNSAEDLERQQVHASSATQELEHLMDSLSQFQIGTRAPIPSEPAPPVAAESKPSELDNMLGNLELDMKGQGVSLLTKGLCGACCKPIVGQVITALGKIWHPEHFCCFSCKEELGTRSFFERDSMPYCEPCYHRLFAPLCGSCNNHILDKCVTAMDTTWHIECFVCEHCGRMLNDEGFHERDGKPYCGQDYFEIFAPKCSRCDQPIIEDFISTLNSHWHTKCFKCMECGVILAGGSFYDHNGEPYCETHYYAKRGSLCAGCQKPITGRCITAMSRKFHPEHFTCAFCLKQLNKGTFKEQNDKPYCHPCFVKLFG